MAISENTGHFGEDDREKPWDSDDGENPPFAEDNEPVDDDEDISGEDDLTDDDEYDLEGEAAFDEDGEEVLDADEAFQAEELPLADDDGRLPWLEPDEDEEEVAGFSTGQTVGLLLSGLLVLALIVGGIWWLTREGPDADLVADGSTIESQGPYKQRPDDPGGKVFEGTGDSSYKVSEGQSDPARLGEKDSTPAPGFQSLDRDKGGDKGEASKPASPAAKPSAPASSGVGVQVGAYSDRASAEAGWNRLKQQYSALSGLNHRVVEGQADIGTVYRLQAVANDAAAAKALCTGLKSSGLNCYVKN